MMIRIRGIRGAESGSIHGEDEKYEVWVRKIEGRR
jgi:hypothetical protein